MERRRVGLTAGADRGVGTWMLLLVAFVLPHAVKGQDLSPLPWVDSGGGCPFECCRLGQWTTETGFIAFEEEHRSEGGTFPIPAGAVITAEEGKVYTTSLGIAVMQTQADVGRSVLAAERPPLVLEAGEAVILLNDHAEAPPNVLIDGREYAVTQFWWDPADGPYTEEASSYSPALLIQPLQREWWVRFHYMGRTGWVDALKVPMQGQLGCG